MAGRFNNNQDIGAWADRMMEENLERRNRWYLIHDDEDEDEHTKEGTGSEENTVPEQVQLPQTETEYQARQAEPREEQVETDERRQNEEEYVTYNEYVQQVEQEERRRTQFTKSRVQDWVDSQRDMLEKSSGGWVRSENLREEHWKLRVKLIMRGVSDSLSMDRARSLDRGTRINRVTRSSRRCCSDCIIGSL